MEQKKKGKEPKVTIVTKQLYTKREEDSENDVDDLHYVLNYLSDRDFYNSDEDQHLLVQIEENKSPEKNVFVLVELTAKQKQKFYLRKANITNTSNEITFMRHSVKFSRNFDFPPVPRNSAICQKDIKFILPKPVTHDKNQTITTIHINHL